MEIDALTRTVIGAAIEVQRVLGVGLLESAYGSALAHELKLRSIHFDREWPIEVDYKGQSTGIAYRADFIVEDQLILELMAVESMQSIHRVQLLSYVRLSNLKVGLLINFHQSPLTRGIHRVVNSL
jgi:GxxExxY protein